MEFEVRYGNVFVMNLLLIGLAIVMAFLSFFGSFSGYGLLKYFCALWMLIAFVRYLSYRRYISLRYRHKPVLTVNEIFIYDAVKNIKYYWKDIEEVYENNLYLYIKLNNPASYIQYISNPYRKFMAKRAVKSQGETPFTINMDMIKVNPNVLLETLDEYSVTSVKQEA